MENILERFKADARGRRGRIGEIARESGVHLKVLRNILYDETTDPRSSNMDKLRSYYADQSA